MENTEFKYDKPDKIVNKVSELFDYILEKTGDEAEAEIISGKLDVGCMSDSFDIDRLKGLADKLIMARRVLRNQND